MTRGSKKTFSTVPSLLVLGLANPDNGTSWVWFDWIFVRTWSRFERKLLYNSTNPLGIQEKCQVLIKILFRQQRKFPPTGLCSNGSIGNLAVNFNRSFPVGSPSGGPYRFVNKGSFPLWVPKNRELSEKRGLKSETIRHSSSQNPGIMISMACLLHQFALGFPWRPEQTSIMFKSLPSSSLHPMMSGTSLTTKLSTVGGGRSKGFSPVPRTGRTLSTFLCTV